MSDLVIRGGTVVTADGEFRHDVHVRGETIARVGPDLDVPSGARVIDAGGAYVMPGGIDPHTHMSLEAMGTVTTEDFFTGTSAAAAGGTTTCIDFVTPEWLYAMRFQGSSSRSPTISGPCSVPPEPLLRRMTA